MFSTSHRKKTGKWGEEELDVWMNFHGWRPLYKNYYFRGGEIDRIYQKQNSLTPNQKNSSLCIAEVKTRLISQPWNETLLFSEFERIHLIRARQIRNLFNCAEIFLANGFSTIFLRVFLILKFEKEVSENHSFSETLPFMLCHWRRDRWILSLNLNLYPSKLSR